MSASPTGATAAGITPAINLDCNAGPGGRCVPAVGGSGAGYYNMTFWTDNNVWNGLNFQQEQGHYFHYNFVASNAATGFGQCQFTAQAFGDLDDDSGTKVFSTYERSGAADQNGVNAAAGLYIDQEVE
jgi:type IV pilus assembly protein PilA